MPSTTWMPGGLSSSFPVPKFANPRGNSYANFGTKGTLASIWFLVPLSNPKFATGLEAWVCELRVRGTSARPFSGTCWRLVEAQHRISTLKLVDRPDEQEQLEILIEATKPQIPPECRHLHYLLATPFRYGAIYPAGSRFRRAGLSEGVFYAADEPETAVAEVTFHRLLFFADSPDTP